MKSRPFTNILNQWFKLLQNATENTDNPLKRLVERLRDEMKCQDMQKHSKLKIPP